MSTNQLTVKPEQSGQNELLNFGMEGLVFEGEFKAIYDSEEEGYILDLSPETVKVEGGNLSELDVTSGSEGSETIDPDEKEEKQSEPSRPVFAVQRGTEWAGADADMNVTTDTFTRLEKLKNEYDVKSATRVGRDNADNNVYQLIYSMEETI